MVCWWCEGRGPYRLGLGGAERQGNHGSRASQHRPCQGKLGQWRERAQAADVPVMDGEAAQGRG